MKLILLENMDLDAAAACQLKCMYLTVELDRGVDKEEKDKKQNKIVDELVEAVAAMHMTSPMAENTEQANETIGIQVNCNALAVANSCHFCTLDDCNNRIQAETEVAKSMGRGRKIDLGNFFALSSVTRLVTALKNHPFFYSDKQHIGKNILTLQQKCPCFWFYAQKIWKMLRSRIKCRYPFLLGIVALQQLVQSGLHGPTWFLIEESWSGAGTDHLVELVTNFATGSKKTARRRCLHVRHNHKCIVNNKTTVCYHTCLVFNWPTESVEGDCLLCFCNQGHRYQFLLHHSVAAIDTIYCYVAAADIVYCYVTAIDIFYCYVAAIHTIYWSWCSHGYHLLLCRSHRYQFLLHHSHRYCLLLHCSYGYCLCYVTAIDIVYCYVTAAIDIIYCYVLAPFG